MMKTINLNDLGIIEKDGKTYYTIKMANDTEDILFYTEIKENRGYIHVNDSIIEKLDVHLVKQSISNICFVLSSRFGITPIIISNIIDRQIDVADSSTLVSSVDPIQFDGDINLDAISTINECIELPLRKACYFLNEKGIKTIMSSCNSEDVRNRYTKISSYRVGQGYNPPFFIGNGYAWIMIDWESLTEENKSVFVEYNSGKKRFPLSERESKILEHNCHLDDPKIPIHWQMVRFFEVMDANKFAEHRSDFGKLEKESELDAYFDLNRNGLLSYSSLNNIASDYRVVVLRYPIDELTTVGEVESFFVNFALQLFNQKIKSHKKVDVNKE